MTKKREPNSGSFKKGQGGRHKGSRNKFSMAVVQAWNNAFDEYGAEVIERVMEKSPETWLKIASGFVPKDLDIQHSGNISVRVVDVRLQTNGTDTSSG